MNFKEVLVDSSRRLIEIISSEVGNDKKLFIELLDYCYLEEKQYSNRASRVVYFCCIDYPHLFFENADRIINQFYSLKDKSVTRNLLGIVFQYINEIKDEEQEGKIADLCFTWLTNPKEPIALRYYAMKILFQLTKRYPEIIHEFIAILENVLIDGSTGLKNHANKLLKILHKKII